VEELYPSYQCVIILLFYIIFIAKFCQVVTKKGLAISTKDFVREKKLQIAIFRL
jgi:hypothetical protein